MTSSNQTGTQNIDLSIIIVNWNAVSFLVNCLSTLYSNLHGIRFEVIIVDNNSTDDCERVLRDQFPAVQFLQSKENLGFGPANNVGFRHSRGRNLLFLNPDTEIIEFAIQTMAAELEAEKDVGIVGARLLNSDLSLQTSCIQSFPTILNLALDSEFLRRRFPKASMWGMRPLFDSDRRNATVEVISGAALMIRRCVFEAIGGFDPGYFMYGEDVDLCFKANSAGWKNRFVPDAVILHHGGGSSNVSSESNFATVVMRESLWRFFRNRRGYLAALTYRLTTFAVAACRLTILGIVILAGGRNRGWPVRQSFSKWMAVFRWAIGLQARVSPSPGGTGLAHVVVLDK